MNQAPQPSASFGRRKLWIQVLAFLAIMALIWLKPRIEEWVDARDQQADASVSEDPADVVKSPADADWVSPISPAAKQDALTESSSIVKMDRSSVRSKTQPVDPERNNPSPKPGTTTNSTELGRLKEIRNNVFQSSGGLVYRSGSEDGHRLKHVMQHAKDNPQKRIHGVFDGDGDRNIILAVIDEAWLKAKKGGSDVRSQRQNDRQVYTVNLRRRIGQMGGEEGERKGHPECRYVRMVLENDNEVITAYPTSSF